MISTCTRCKQMHEFTTEEADAKDRLCKLCAAAVAADEFSDLVRKRIGFRGSNYSCPNRVRLTTPNGQEVCCAAIDGEWALDRKNPPPEHAPYRCTGCDHAVPGLLAEEKELHPETEAPKAVPLVELVAEPEAPSAEIPQSPEATLHPFQQLMLIQAVAQFIAASAIAACPPDAGEADLERSVESLNDEHDDAHDAHETEPWTYAQARRYLEAAVAVCARRLGVTP
jgi:hypothetical protein